MVEIGNTKQNQIQTKTLEYNINKRIVLWVDNVSVSVY